MGELLAAILGAIAKLLLEAFLEIIAALVVDIVSTAFLDLFTGLREAIQGSRVLTGFMYRLLGMLTGALSLLVLLHRVVHRERPFGFHGISLLISPIIAGLAVTHLFESVTSSDEVFVDRSDFLCLELQGTHVCDR